VGCENGSVAPDLRTYGQLGNILTANMMVDDLIDSCGGTAEAPLHRALTEITRLAAQHLNKTVTEVLQTNFLLSHNCRYHRHDEEHPRCGEGL
jgi:hypothetical protein